MRTSIKISFLIFSVNLLMTSLVYSQHNQLTASERDSGFVLLFDGQSIDGDVWKQWSPHKGPLDRSRYVVDQTEQAMHKTGGATNGSIMVDSIYADFIFKFEFKIINKPGTDNANGGIIYRCFFSEWPAAAGIEYQMMDVSTSVNNATGAAYGIYAPDPYNWKSNEWNTGQIHADGDIGSHYLNGDRVVHYDRASSDFLNRLGNSRFGAFTGTDPVDGASADFSNSKQGWFVLQDYGDGYDWWFRNLKIARLPIPVSKVLDRKNSFFDIYKDNLSVQFDVNYVGVNRLIIQTVSGKVLYRSSNGKKLSHRLSIESPGVYVVQLLNESGIRVSMKKFVVE